MTSQSQRFFEGYTVMFFFNEVFSQAFEMIITSPTLILLDHSK